MRQSSSLKIGEIELGQGLVLAPMAGITDLSFRRIAKEFGADVVTSEMVSSEGLVRNKASTKMLLQSHPEEKPLAVQIFGSDPQVMAQAARIVEDEGAAIIDLNMGCPVVKVVRQGAGAALLLDTEKVSRIVDAVRRAVGISVTVKTRAGWNQSKINVLQVAAAAESAGVDAITIHPRTAKQGFSGSADWTLISKVKEAVAVPVIGNGDVTRPEHVDEMRQLTGCDGVMIGRAAMGNPWIFKQAKQLAGGQTIASPSMHERLEVMRRHLALHEEPLHGRRSLAGFCSRIMWYTKGLRGSARLRASLTGCRQVEDMIKVCEDFFAALEE
ncbi:MAG: tRNA dihydrouridine synthase DusB [Deltaproteobacteria bacterium]|nr:tRNA dihydrouridine synthase DusB [Deltaproteobacteria bacterium]